MSGAAAHYDAPARVMHWLVALLVPAQVVLGLLGERLPDQQLARLLLLAHFQLGVLLVVVVTARVSWRLLRGTPPWPDYGTRWQWRIAVGVHRLLYALLLVLPASGYVIWVWMGAPRELLGLATVPALFTPPIEDESARAAAWYIHVYGAWLLLALLVLHVAAAWRAGRRHPALGIAGRMRRGRDLL